MIAEVDAAVTPSPPSRRSRVEESGDDSPELIAAYFDRLWPILRSITGEGVRRTHDILGELMPLERLEIPTGTQCFDWVVPQEWVFREAYVVDPWGRRILDAAENNLHVVNYSAPFRGRIPLERLQEHLHSLPEQPDAVPYVTSYYRQHWGFCISERMRRSLPQGEYQVVIDTEHVDGSLTISHAVLPGTTDREVLISTYTCHPSLANNELSGPLVAAFLYRRLARIRNRRLTYRFVFLPETIGSIAYLAQFGEHLRRHLEAGFVLSCIGDPAPFTFMESRRGRTAADRAAKAVLRRRSPGALRELPFSPYGSDERQYCSPGFNLPVGVIARSIYSEYDEYHTSLDNRDFISFEALRESVDVCAEICETLDGNEVYRRVMPFCEPQLGRRGLYPSVGGAQSVSERLQAMLWFLNLADGENDLLAIAERSGVSFDLLLEVARDCADAALVERIHPQR